VVDLPHGSTPIDFAYHIHTEVGHRCRGAKVNGRIVPLSYELKNGDQVEILTAKRGGPSRDWMNSHLGYVKTARARAKIRYWFKHQNYEENVSNGRIILERELHRLGLPEINFEKLAHEFKFHKVDDFLAAIGRNDVGITQLISVINRAVALAEPEEQEEWQLLAPLPMPVRQQSTGVQVQGVGNLLTNLAQCCRPVPGDPEIIGYITQGRGVTIHRGDCPNVLRLREKSPERLIAVDWGIQRDVTYPVDIQIEAFDRPGLLRDITGVFANEKINLSTVNVVTRKKEHKAKVLATLDISNIDQLSRALAKVEQLPNVTEVRRRI
jgi:GTP pyrophosphokinase